MTDDAELLDRFIVDRSDAAFAQLVERHIGMVYHAALRQLGADADQAKDISQLVFVLLAQKARSLRRHPCLGGWLHVATHRKVSEAIRAERRRRIREHEAFMTQDNRPDSVSEADWVQIRSSLDDAILRLRRGDREALTLRFFEGRTLREISSRLSLSEAAAQKRISRALEKMRRVLAGRGVTSTASALTAILSGQAALAAPEGLASSISAAALASGAAGSGALASAKLAFLRTFMGIKTKTATVVAIASGVGLITYQTYEHNGLQKELGAMKAENQLLISHAQEFASAKSSSATALATTRARVAELLSDLQKAGGKENAVVADAQRPLATGMKAIGQAANAGQGNPTSAAESLFWASSNRQASSLAQMMVMDAATQKAAADLFDGLPSDLRAQIQSPEEMMADWLAASFPKNVVGYQLAPVNQGPESDRVDVPMVLELANGQTVVSGFNLQQVGGNWMLALNPGYVQSLAANLGALTHP